MTVPEAAQALVDAGPQEPRPEPDPTEALVTKVAEIAERTGKSPILIPGSEFTDEERPLLTPAVAERAARLIQERKVRADIDSRVQAAKLVDGGGTPLEDLEKQPKVTSKRPRASSVELPVLPKREDGWWLDNRAAGDETMPEFGPYDTKKEAEEARVSLIRSKRILDQQELERNQQDKKAAKSEAKERARKAGTGANKTSSEPKSAKSGSGAGQTESEEPVKEDNPRGKQKPRRTAEKMAREVRAKIRGARAKQNGHKPRGKVLGKYPAGPFVRWLGRKGFDLESAKRILKAEGCGHLTDASIGWELKEPRETRPPAKVAKEDREVLEKKYSKEFAAAKK